MSRKPRRENKPNAEAFSEALASIEQARETGATELDLSELGLTKLPEDIAQLTQLRELNLSNNQLIALPEAIGQLLQLQSLVIYGNQLALLPESIGQLVLLRELIVSDNKLIALSNSIGKLIKLQRLFLSLNKLTQLPDSIINLSNLTYLALGENLLTEIPEAIGYLQNLQFLDLSIGVGHIVLDLPLIKNLTRPYLSASRVGTGKKSDTLKSLPDSLQNLRFLRELYLHGNEALSLPAEVLGPTWEDVNEDARKDVKPAKARDILDYYFRVLIGERPLNEAKLILVGRGAVGKTSLVKRLVHNRFDKSEKKTEGIRITEWPLRLRRREQVRLNIWDFGGQEIMHATHQFFLTPRSLYLLVLNGREGGEDVDAEYWLKLIESFGSDSPVIVVLNKIKEHPFDLNRRALQQKYPIREFIKTDCEDGTGIAELRKII